MSGVRNKLIDLNNHLFEEMERLNTDGISDEKLTKEIKRTNAMVDLAEQIVDNAKVILEANKFKVEYSRSSNVKVPEMLTDTNDTNNTNKNTDDDK